MTRRLALRNRFLERCQHIGVAQPFQLGPIAPPKGFKNHLIGCFRTLHELRHIEIAVSSDQGAHARFSSRRNQAVGQANRIARNVRHRARLKHSDLRPFFGRT